ncbi:hypothetical protein AMELA_G00037660 [Ameiurus melas]|uniref:Uncharacterized protein n=1 Tax=Ameiurus melas TaxID=219545 RepID=A0A7J6B8W1_AMEME|nr:hypothetical protein AMELA_G00037660 [Ameiurus melas]
MPKEQVHLILFCGVVSSLILTPTAIDLEPTSSSCRLIALMCSPVANYREMDPCEESGTTTITTSVPQIVECHISRSPSLESVLTSDTTARTMIMDGFALSSPLFRTVLVRLSLQVQCLTVDQDYGSRVQALLDKYNAKRTLCTFIRREPQREVCLRGESRTSHSPGSTGHSLLRKVAKAALCFMELDCPRVSKLQERQFSQNRALPLIWTVLKKAFLSASKSCRLNRRVELSGASKIPKIIPRSLVRVVSITQIHTDHGVNIQFPEKNDENQHQISITGYEANAIAAHDAIQGIVDELGDDL